MESEAGLLLGSRAPLVLVQNKLFSVQFCCARFSAASSLSKSLWAKKQHGLLHTYFLDSRFTIVQESFLQSLDCRKRP